MTIWRTRPHFGANPTGRRVLLHRKFGLAYGVECLSEPFQRLIEHWLQIECALVQGGS